MKKLFLIPLIIIIIAGLIFSGCAKPTPAPIPTPEPTPAPAPAAPIELKLSTFVPPAGTLPTRVFSPWAKQVEELSGGRVKITIYAAEALGKAADQYDMVLSGTADIVQMDTAWTPGVFPLAGAQSLPFLFDTAEASGTAFHEVAEKYLFDTEFKNVKVLWYLSIGPSQIFTKNKPIQTMEDLSGQKLATTAEVGVKNLKALGATPVLQPIPEFYTAIERGMVDGAVDSWTSAMVFKFFEVTKYRTVANLWTTSGTVIAMNLDSWNSLPPDIKQIFEKTTGLEEARGTGVAFDTTDKVAIQMITEFDKAKDNPPIYQLPDAERARWRQTLTPLYEAWIAEKEAKGLPARAFFEDLLKAAEKYNPKK